MADNGTEESSPVVKQNNMNEISKTSPDLARARGLDHTHILKSVAVCKVYNSSHLELIVKDLGKYVNDFNAKLVIIDGIISLHRAEFAGRGTLADRQQRLNSMLHKALRLSRVS